MDFQAAPLDHDVGIEASLDSHLDASINAAMDAAKDAADAVDDLVQHLNTAEAVDIAAPAVEDSLDFVSNQSASEAEPVFEEIVAQVQRSLEVPFVLIASTLALGLIIIFVMFLRQRHRRRNAPKSIPVEAPEEEEEEEVAAEEPVVEDAAAATTAAAAAAAEEEEDEEVVAEKAVVAEELAAAVDGDSEPVITPASEIRENDIPCVEASEPEFQAMASACPVDTDLIEFSSS